MELAVGTIISGKVTAITKFGAFVSLPGGKSGLVHISEVAAAFVSDVHDYLAEGPRAVVPVPAAAGGLPVRHRPQWPCSPRRSRPSRTS